MTITVESMKKEHPDVANALIAEGRQAAATEATTAATAAGRVEGANAERARIQAVLDQSMPGHEVLVKTLAFDGKTTGPEAAVQILKAEKAKGKQLVADLESDAAGAKVPDGGGPGPDADPKKASDSAAIATKAQAYIAEQAKLGRTVSAAEAVDHVMKENGNG